MAKFLAVQIRLGKITLNDVPEHLKDAVQEIIDSQQIYFTQGEELNSAEEILGSKNDNGTFNEVVDDRIKLGEEIKSEIIEQIINALQQSKRS
ncbi:hypothetical protein [Desulforamulus ruminis]|uniref:hypothetical protein n=1 Tax=Desulforamulus ruminis TaxID=1564 RepID=UPI0023568447|nr:hypothetical protein [Desulforamulus ruminis]